MSARFGEQPAATPWCGAEAADLCSLSQQMDRKYRNKQETCLQTEARCGWAPDFGGRGR